MDRRVFLGALAGSVLLTAPFPAEAQQPGKVYRIGVLEQGGSPGPNPIYEAFRQQLRELGYIEGQNLVLENRFAEGRAERLPDFAAELVRLKVDVIVAGGTLGPLAARSSWRQQVTQWGPGLWRTGGNVTGLSNHSAELTGKRLQLTKEVVPGLSRMAVLWNAANPIAALVFKETEIAARTWGVQVQSVEVRRSEDFDRALPATVSGGAGALFVIDDPLVFRSRMRIADFAARNRLPATAFYKQFAEAGGLMTFGASLADLYRRAAIFVDKILKGAKPGDLPVEQPTTYELVINLKTAKTLGLTIPPSLLQRADQVIE